MLGKDTIKSFIFLFVLATSLPVVGQTDLVGIKGGVNTTNFWGGDYNGPYHLGNVFGFSGGLTYEYHSNKSINYGIDLLHVKRGGHGSFDSGLQNEISEYWNFNYLSLPIKGGVLFGDLFSVSANFGIIPSLLINQFSYVNTTTPEGETVSLTGQQDVNKFDCAVLFELGLNCRLFSSLYIHITFGYQKSFTTDESFKNGGGYRNEGLVPHFGIKYGLPKNKKATR